MTELAYDNLASAMNAKTRFDSRMTMQEMRQGRYDVIEARDENGRYWIVKWVKREKAA